jgi:hypothetical protein
MKPTALSARCIFYALVFGCLAWAVIGACAAGIAALIGG